MLSAMGLQLHEGLYRLPGTAKARAIGKMEAYEQPHKGEHHRTSKGRHWASYNIYIIIYYIYCIYVFWFQVLPARGY